MKKAFKVIAVVLLIQVALPGNEEFRTRVSFLNIGFDYTKYTNSSELYRSLFIIPFIFEKKNFELGLYMTPFVKETYDAFGHYKHDALPDSYLLNFRFRYIRSAYKQINIFFDLAYCDGESYNWKDIYVSWLEVGIYKRLNYTTKLFLGYKYTLNTNENIDMDGIFFNLIFGYSFLKRK